MFRSGNPRNYRRSEISGDIFPIADCRLAIVGKNEVSHQRVFDGTISKVDVSSPEMKRAISAINIYFWNSLEQDIFGRKYRVMECENIAAIPREQINVSHRGIAGHIGYCIEDEGYLHIVVFHVWPEWSGSGVGGKLLDNAIEEAKSAGLSTIKLGTTNDNLPAIYFYQRNGFVIESVILVSVSERMQTEVGGFAGIPVRDEIHMRLDI